VNEHHLPIGKVMSSATRSLVQALVRRRHAHLERVLRVRLDLQQCHVKFTRLRPVGDRIDEEIVLSLEVEVPDPWMLPGARRERHPRVVFAEPDASREADGGVVVLLHFAEFHLCAERIVRVFELQADRRVASRSPWIGGLEKEPVEVQVV
jgi:hypothetical protein